MRRALGLVWLLLGLVCVPAAWAGIFSALRGVVHDGQHRPIAGAVVELHGVSSGLTATVTTGADGMYSFAAVPLGEYGVTVSAKGFRAEQRGVRMAADTPAVLHVELAVEGGAESVTVESGGLSEASATPSTLISREEIAETPGASLTNSLAMITDYVPGAYITHDMLHMRGGHQVGWLIDGVEIPNTNIASNVGAQIDPKDIDSLEVERGSYAAGTGDRTYGVFNVVPRTGFEREREGELVATAGSFLQTNDQVSLGDHTERFAYYASANGNRSDYGLSPPVGQVRHDASNGVGGFTSMIYNRTPRDQLRAVGQARRDFFQIPYDPDANSFGNQVYDSSELRDTQTEHDGLAILSWLHTIGRSTVVLVSPFYHGNSADYEPGAGEAPVATVARRRSDYGGGEVSVTGEIARHTLEAGAHGFGQHDGYTVGASFNDGSGFAPFLKSEGASGGVVAGYVSDNWRATSWLTLIGGVRQTHFTGAFSEDATSPRAGVSVRVPRLGWVFRGFYGRFYQPPPLATASGPVLEFAQANNTDFVPLRGERDEEHQFGVRIPVRGWVVDADTFRTRVRNFLDHSNIGDSSIYYPVTVDGALVRAWELTVRSPGGWRYGQVHLAYSNQIAEQRGAITGGLICAPVSSPQCDVTPGYRPVDHDQRNTLNVGYRAALPWGVAGSTNVYYGSGFINGNPDATTPYPNPYLPQHTTVDLALSKRLTERVKVSVTALNVGNRRVLLDNSLTFGGFHFNDPRQVYGDVRYRFRY